MNNYNKYIDVILPLPVKGSFTYSLRSDDNVRIGQRVVVQFGVKKLYTAIIIKVHNNLPKYKVKDILSVFDDENIVTENQIRFWQWLSSYYMSQIGDIMNAAMPSLLKLSSESKIIVHPNFDGDVSDLSRSESSILNLLALKDQLTISEASEYFHGSSFSSIYEMIRKELIQIREELRSYVKPKKVKFVSLSGNNFDAYFDLVNRSNKQKELLEFFIECNQENSLNKIRSSDLLNKYGFSRFALNALQKKGIVNIESQEVSRLKSNHVETHPIYDLSSQQKIALHEVKSIFNDKDVCLLHGVTSSGKTQIYIKLIQEYLNQDQQILYLLPEIALTAQIVNRLKRHFGDMVEVFHSRLSDQERIEVWNAIKETDVSKKRCKIILGARSALFLPFVDLGIVIVDEEHDSSYKQTQKSPRYNARDASIYLASLHNAKVLLGSATPSLETYFNAKSGKFGLVKLNSRFLNIDMPNIHIVDIGRLYLKKKMINHFSPLLVDQISTALSVNKQVILFQNRRGYSPVLECEVCNWSPRCVNCDITLTYHKNSNSLRCHYCSYHIDKLDSCQSCNHHQIIDKGFGTEQIEEEISSLFPKARVSRMDYDTTRGKYSYDNIIENFSNGLIDILIGTKMVTKGLDFDNVSIVGVLYADVMLKFPNFRALERSYQLLSQVAGRAGRKSVQGDVIIQTYSPDNYVINTVSNHDYDAMYNQQLNDRRLFGYPPYSRLILINLQHKNCTRLDIFADKFYDSLSRIFHQRVLGPQSPYVSKVRRYYQKNILLKLESSSSVSKAKNILDRLINKYQDIKSFRSIRINIDVDPD